MVIAQHLWRALVPGGAVRVDQGLRVDFEVAARGGVDVARGPGFGDPRALPQQDPASFEGMRSGGMGAELSESAGTNLNLRSP